ncbi:hypothetical protein MOE57_14730 [Bacillus inaquosorum]|uniref:hypothetical protein n=1 Tax=Bacillus inaquosorum TaxID=483913 RepID=UPI00227E0593|nr:hypothetical protein [Bacillus inaquosorum]MCY9083723.1 hypothetical protein [Bacillus inaquosorum]
MIQVYRYDENFVFAEPVLVNEKDDAGNYVIPGFCTEIAPPDSPSLFKPKFNTETQEWTESATQEEIDAILNSGNVEVSAIDLLKQQNAKLTLQLATVNKENEERRQREAEMALLLAQLQSDINTMKGAN